MANSKVLDTQILLTGHIDPSVVAAMARGAEYIRKLSQEWKKNEQAIYGDAAAVQQLNARIRITQSMSQQLGASMRRIGEIASGVAVGDLLASGFERALGVAERIGEKLIEFGRQASELAAKRELMSKGLGNILGDQGLANAIMERQQATAILSPFQATDLQQTVKRYVAAGADANMAEWLTKRSGDIVAGVGGGAEAMERAALAFGKIIAGGRLTGQEGKELKDLGIPYEKTLAQIMGAKNPEELAKMQRQGKISADVVMQMVKQMTDVGGIFHDGMLNFSKTMVGLETSFLDVWHKFQANFNEVINDWAAVAADFAVNNDMWNQATSWMNHFRQMSKSVLSILTTLPTSESFGKFKPFIDAFQGSIRSFTKYVSSFFTTVEIPNQGNVLALNETGVGAVREIVKNITDVLSEMSKLVTSPMVQDLAKASWQGVKDFFVEAFTTLKAITELYADFKSHDIKKFWEDWDKYSGKVHGPEAPENEARHRLNKRRKSATRRTSLMRW